MTYRTKARITMSILLVISLIICILLTGCGTVAGIGSDLQRGASWMQDKLDNGFDQEGARHERY